jgi:hypothetical protein
MSESGPVLVQSRPVIKEAFYFDGTAESAQELVLWAREHVADAPIERYDGGLRIETLEGSLFREGPGWIIKGLKDEFYPCDEEIFESSYQRLVHRP